jgi:DNA-binding XRE family transcriptional regulator
MGSTVRQLRLDHGWSQSRLAREAGVADHTIVRVEAGRPASDLTVARVARALGVDVGALDGAELALTK